MVYAKRGVVVRVVYLGIACVWFLFTSLFRKQIKGCVTLCYHGVKKSQRGRFHKQMKLVAARTVSVEDFSRGQKNRRLSVCVTFDDAFENLLSNALPTIEKLEIPIVIFVPTGSLGNCPLWLKDKGHCDSGEIVMTYHQLSALNINPLVTLGSHTVSHPRLSSLSAYEVEKELYKSKRVVEGISNTVVDQLAFPHGDCSNTVIEKAMELGYRKVYTLDPVIYVEENQEGIGVVGRFSMSPDVWPIEFFLTVKGAYRWLYPWRSFINNI